MSQEIADLLRSIAAVPVTECWPRMADEKQGCLSHGDFTPWNMLRTAHGVVLIDWEFAALRPEGWDLVHFEVQRRSFFGSREPRREAGEAIAVLRDWTPRVYPNLRCAEDLIVNYCRTTLGTKMASTARSRQIRQVVIDQLRGN